MMTGAKVALGPLCQEHVPLYYRWLNEPEVALHYFRGDLRPEPLEELEERYKRLKRDVSFTIYDKAALQPIGICQLLDVDHFNRTAEYGICIGEKRFWGQGCGTEATLLTLRWGFQGLGLNNILLTVFDYNQRGLGAYRRAGFREFGRRRQAKRLGQRLCDVVYMECLYEEFNGGEMADLTAGK